MNLIEAIERRHSVRQYMDKPIPEEIVLRLPSTPATRWGTFIFSWC